HVSNSAPSAAAMTTTTTTTTTSSSSSGFRPGLPATASGTSKDPYFQVQELREFLCPRPSLLHMFCCCWFEQQRVSVCLRHDALGHVSLSHRKPLATHTHTHTHTHLSLSISLFCFTNIPHIRSF
ncbi:MAG: hypothetical protein ACK41O_26700, partial [Runella zeae]